MKTINQIIIETKQKTGKDKLCIGICGHVRPDGDCIGSTLGLYGYLSHTAGKYLDLHVYLEAFKPQFTNVLSLTQEVTSQYDGLHFDILFVLDCSDENRIGVLEEPFSYADYTVCIDHHISNNGFGDYNYTMPNASSAAETLFGLFDADGIDAQTADCLMTGIVHDTGVFKHQNTGKNTLEVAAALLGKGARLSTIINDTYYLKTYVQMKISGIAYENAYLTCDNKIICCALTKQQMDSQGADAKDLDGIVDVLRGTEGVECAIFLYPTSEDTYKVSLRSNKNVNVSEIAAIYGGGGHVRAAGFSMQKSKEEIFDELVEIISNKMNE